jgi:hypothetical protein
LGASEEGSLVLRVLLAVDKKKAPRTSSGTPHFGATAFPRPPLRDRGPTSYIENTACVKLAISKGFSIGIVGASSVVKVPQIINEVYHGAPRHIVRNGGLFSIPEILPSFSLFFSKVQNLLDLVVDLLVMTFWQNSFLLFCIY